MIDAHHHIWRQADLSWLTGPEQPRIFGPYGAIRRDYLMAEYLADIAGTGITRSVYVQANWAPEAGLTEARWVQSVADETGWPHAIIAYCDFTADDVPCQLEAFKTIPDVRGFRQQLHWHETPQYRFAPAEQITDPRLARGIRALGTYGWTFDLQVFPGQMADAARLARTCPDVTFILQHAGMLEDISDTGRAKWRAGMETLAAEPNIATKLSAFGTFIHRNDADHIARITADTVAIFGADRCMFGSNFPIEKLWTAYGDLFAAHRAATAHLSAAQQDAVFNDTAARIYRLN